jgi:two-component system response regulator MprA
LSSGCGSDEEDKVNPNILPRILIVDDEPHIRLLLGEFLSGEYVTGFATNGNEAVQMALDWKPDLILMDVMMPDLDGISAVQKIRDREATRHVPVLMVTAANTTRQRIQAFDGGADDYISKPFEVEELLSRIRSRLNRIRQIRDGSLEVLEFGNLVLDLRAREVRIEGKELEPGPVEYGILEILLRRPGEVVSRRQIMERVWEDGSKSDRLIDAHLSSLRRKTTGWNAEIQTVYGEGYRLRIRS